MEAKFKKSDGTEIPIRGLKRKEVRGLRQQGHKVENLKFGEDLTDEDRNQIFELADAVIVSVLGQEVADDLLEGDAMKAFNEIFKLTYPTEEVQKN
jgi:hypothetical protein